MRRFSIWWSSGFGSGFLPKAPGTWGSVLGCLIAWGGAAWFQSQFLLFFIISILIYTGISMYTITQILPEWGEDPPLVVADEILGMWITLCFVPVDWIWWILALIGFRVFDIRKPLGIRRLERIPGATGILLDDVLAGIYAGYLLWLLHYGWKAWS